MYSNSDAVRDTLVTAYKQGRAYRTFKELNIPASGTYVIKIVVPASGATLRKLSTAIDLGYLKLETIAGGTEGGTYSETLPRIRRNLLPRAPVRLPEVTMTAGGTQTGGTVIDVIRSKADTNTNRAISVGASDDDDRGVAPGTYYWKFTNLSSTDAITGTFKAQWTEP